MPKNTLSAIRDSLINLIYIMKLKIVAEGIEDGNQVSRLIRGKCDIIQSYYYDKPIENYKAKERIEHIYKLKS